MLVNMNEVLKPAQKGKYAIGLFNSVNLELARGIIAAAESTGSPIIMGTAEILFPYGPLEELSYFLIPMAKKASVPVVIHLDHGLNRETCIRALELGFSSIMYDCSMDSYETNVRKVKEIVEIAHSYGATVEGELGHVGDNEGSAEGNSNLSDPSAFYTDPMQAKDFVLKTGVDALAIAVGTAHGTYKLPPKLDFERIESIAKAVEIPLVLHGGSGLTDLDFRHAIRKGISKINIFTDINVAAAEAQFQAFQSVNKGTIDLIPAVVEATKQEVIKKLELFESTGKKFKIPAQESKIVVAGHICLDITPAFPETQLDHVESKVEEILIPGKLLQMENVDVHIGGAVANTGLALKKLGAEVSLMGKIGQDSFGDLVYSQVKTHDAHRGMIRSKKVHTSYSVVIAPPGIDRIFLHHPGANDSFYMEDLDFTQIEQAELFHFGYPPLMKSMYENDGKELVRLFQKVKSMGTATSLDMASVDEHAAAGEVNWEEILKKVIPFVDFFLPSIEELAYMIDRKCYEEWKKRANGKDMISVLDPHQDIEPLAQKLLSFGAKVVLIKCGALGLYFATGDSMAMNSVSGPIGKKVHKWANIRHFEKSYKPERIRSGTGAGDTSIAAFLFAVMSNYNYEECLKLAAATGASCVAEYDALSGLKPFSVLQEKIQNGWEKLRK